MSNPKETVTPAILVTADKAKEVKEKFAVKEKQLNNGKEIKK